MTPTSSGGADSWGLGEEEGVEGAWASRDEKNQAAKLEEQKGGLGTGRAAGLSRDSVLGAACPPQGAPRP